MNRSIITSLVAGTAVGDEITLTTVELCRTCRTSAEQVQTWVVEGVLQPSGEAREEWRFGGTELSRLRIATRLAHDLDVNTAGVALALDLLDRISLLERELVRAGVALPAPRE